MAVKLDELNPTPGLTTTDIMVSRQGSEDYRATLQQLTDLVKSGMTAQEIMDLVLQVDTDTSGLNANFLQGLTSSFLRDAGNLNAGVVSNSRLPNGVSNQTTSSNRVMLPTFLTGGQRLMLQWGVTPYVADSVTTFLTFPAPFVWGIGTGVHANLPLLIVTPECLPDAASAPWQNVELDIRATNVTLSGASLHTIRTAGSSGDQVRAHWFAVGRY